MPVNILHATFARGELSPRLHGRADIEHYAMSLATCKNWIVMRQGGLTRRPGFNFIAEVKDSSKKTRMVQWEFNVEQAYALEFGENYIRFHTLGGRVTETAQDITDITKANPGVVTYSGADNYSNGDRVVITGVVGMTEVNNREFTVANVDTGANTFELSGVDTSTYTTYSSGGSVSEIVEVTTTYGEDELFDLQFAQSGDTLYIAHEDHRPAKLVRASETSWTLSDIDFDDGPFLDEETSGVTMTPADTGSAVPDMTGLTSPSGTAANSDGDADAWQVFDRDPGTHSQNATVPAWWSYDFPSTNTKIVDAYWVQASYRDSAVGADRTPMRWQLQGYDGSDWITLDLREGETAWVQSEVRFFEFLNTQGFQSYRLYVFVPEAADGNAEISQLSLHEAGDGQTAFNLTASAVTGINGGSGFVATDVGRTIRLLGTDGVWRWAYIDSRTNSTVVKVKLYHHALPDLTAITHWRLSSWSVSDGYPKCVSFYQERLGWASSDTEPRNVWLSRTASYEDHGISDPVQDNDGINVDIAGGQLNRIAFIEELSDLVVATAGRIYILGPVDSGAAFSSTNARARPQSEIGAASIQPVSTGSALIYADRYAKRVQELAFNYEINSYQAKELSILSDHLVASGITEFAFQQQPHNLVWTVEGDGTPAVLTYEPNQQIAGWSQMAIAGGGTDDAVVESVASIPSTGGDVIYAIVKRTIDGGTVRYVEYMAPFYETGDDITDAVFFDSALTYDSSSTGTVTGAWHLRGETVGILADGLDIGDAMVTDTGSVTLPDSVTASTIQLGKRYTSRAQSLRAPQSGNRDGTALGRKMAINRLAVDMMDTGFLKAGTLEGTRDAAYRTWETAATAPITLITEMKDIPIRDSHKNEGVYVLTTDKGYPATVRAVRVELQGEP